MPGWLWGASIYAKCINWGPGASADSCWICNQWSTRLIGACTNPQLQSKQKGCQRKKLDSEDSPEYLHALLIKPLSKCNKKCTSKCDAIQCNLCGTCVVHVWYMCSFLLWGHHRWSVQSSLDNHVYYFQTHDCLTRTKNILYDWITSHNSFSIENTVASILWASSTLRIHRQFINQDGSTNS